MVGIRQPRSIRQPTVNVVSSGIGAALAVRQLREPGSELAEVPGR